MNDLMADTVDFMTDQTRPRQVDLVSGGVEARDVGAPGGADIPSMWLA
jgi:hypothetical protein